MHTELIDLKRHWTLVEVAENAFSFVPLLNRIKRRINNEETIKAEFYRFVLKKCKKYPCIFNGPIKLQEIGQYSEILEFVYTLLTPAMESGANFYWALSTPVPLQMVYSTDAFFEFICDYNAANASLGGEESALLRANQTDFIYELILQKLYDFPADLNNDVIYSYIDSSSNLSKYFRINVNQEFVHVEFSGKLPPLNPEIIEPCIYEGVGMDILKDIIPLNQFKLSGFSVITITEISSENAVDNIRNLLVNEAPDRNKQYKSIAGSLRVLSGKPTIEFGLLPFIKINKEIVLRSEACQNSLLVSLSKRYRASAQVVQEFLTAFTKVPASLFVSTINDQKIGKYPFLNVIRRAGINSYAILPVYYNRYLVGMIEIYSFQKIIFYEKLLMSLQAGIPFISQLFKDSIDEANLKIEKIIKEKFTILQPSVEWKFNAAAWDYLNTPGKNDGHEIATVTFPSITPLYGAVDIRSSTKEHNRAFKKDKAQLSALLKQKTRALKAMLPEKTYNELARKLLEWQNTIKTTVDEVLLNTYMFDTIGGYFCDLIKKYPDTKKIIDDYNNEINEKSGKVYTNRNRVEHSITEINRYLNWYFEKQQEALQKIFPCYFEKFRSDGIEYNLYVGESLTTEKVFDGSLMKKFREWQIRSMIEIAGQTHLLADKLPIQMHTTSLIFVHSGPIDISFRNDERRFDVEGYYNIRYEVFKKRIDKATIKNTHGRLTAPGKIAIVYINEDDIGPYLKYIKKCQKSGSLLNDLQFIELDKLQEISGIKAIRVSVNLKKLP